MAFLSGMHQALGDHFEIEQVNDCCSINDAKKICKFTMRAFSHSKLTIPLMGFHTRCGKLKCN